MSSSSLSRVPPQLTLRQLLIGVTLVGVILGIYRIAGAQAFVHYAFLLFAVGPWFAHLATECLPVQSQQVRTAVANVLLLVLFAVILKLTERIVPGPAALIVIIAAVVLWTPQYMLFMIWRNPEVASDKLQ